MTMTAQDTADSLAEMTGAFERRRDAILAALLAERKAALAGVRVKPLEWVEDWSGDNEDIPVWRGLNHLNMHVGFSFAGELFEGMRLDRHQDAPIDRVTAAKAAAQANYESRIRSVLESGEDRYEEGWKAALAEAAEVALKSFRAPACPFDGKNDLEPTDPCPVCGDLGTFDDANMNRPVKCGTVNSQIASAILALSPEGKGPDDWRTMDSAPEAEPILVWVKDAHRGTDSAEVVVLCRVDGEVTFWTNGGPNGGSDMDFPIAPTHWRPLPSPPTDHTPEEET